MSNPGPASTSTTASLGGGSPQYVGTAATSLVGFYGATPAVQGSTIASVSTSQPVVTTTPTTVYGFANSAQFNSLIAAVNSLSALLQAKGLIA